jgi:hypothetical protein
MMPFQRCGTVVLLLIETFAMDVESHQKPEFKSSNKKTKL